MKSVSLRIRLSLALLGFAGMILLALMVAIDHLGNQMALSAARRNLSLAQALAGQIRLLLQLPLDSVEHLSDLDGSTFQKHATIVLRKNPSIVRIHLINADGYVLQAVPDQHTIGLDFSNQPYVEEGLQTHAIGWSKASFNIDGELTVCLTIPHKQGLIVAHIGLDHFSRQVADILGERPGELAVFDASGVIIAHSDITPAEHRQNISNLDAVRAVLEGHRVLQRESVEGSMRLISAASIPDTSWAVMVAEPEAAALQDLIRLQRGLLLGGFAVIALAFIISQLMMNRFLRPVLRFIKHAQRVASGDYPARINTPYVELQGLARAFSDMGASLQQREADLHQSRTEYRNLVEQADALILHLDRSGTISFMNRSAQVFFGHDLERVQGHDPHTCLFDDINAASRKLLRQSESETEVKAEASCYDSHGREHIVAWQIRRIENDQSRLLIGSDLTELRRTDRALQAVIATAARESGASLIERITRALCDYLDTDVAYAATIRRGDVRILAQSCRLDTDTSGFELPDVLPLHDSPGQTVMHEDWVLVGQQVRQRYPNDAFLQQWQMESYAGIAMHASDGRPLGLLCTLSRTPLALPSEAREVFDILSDRIAAELERERVLTELRASQSHLAQAQRIAGLGTWSCDPVNEHIHWSPEVSAIFGYAPDAAPPSREAFYEHIHPEDRERVHASFQDCLQHGRPLKMEYRIHDTQGTLHHLTVSAEAITDHDGTTRHISGTVVDVTTHRQMQEHLNHGEKMRAIGQLAGGIAHDFNNQLTGILGFSEFLEEQLENERLRSYAANIRISAERAAQLTQQLLSFARRGRMQQVIVDGHAIIHEVLQILRHTLDKRIDLQAQLHAERSELRGDPSQLQNAILNLAINARDAMPSGGTLSIKTWNEICRATDGKEHDCLAVEIRDTGIGMSPDIMKHIFEPFFTTKESGSGTGMGLAAVEGTVGQHGGTISVESELGSGSCFTLRMPLAPRNAADLTPLRSDQLPSEDQQQATIMVVDDEETIRVLLQDILEDMGHTVISAAGGAEAQEHIQQQGHRIDLVLLDLMMPPPDGSATFTAIRSHIPDLPIVIMSGYARSGSAQTLLDAGAQAFLQKPFDRASLERLLADILSVKPSDER